MILFSKIDKEQYKDFYSKNAQSFMQSYEWGEFNKIGRNQIPHYVGLIEDGKVLCEALLLEKRMFNLSYFYSPRGFIIDFNNYELLKKFTIELGKYIKKNNGIYLKFDPEIEYQEIDDNACPIPSGYNNYDLFNNIISLGYKHTGFTKHFENNQPRYTFIIDLSNDMKTLEKNIHKSVMKKIRKTFEYDMVFRKSSNVDLFYELLTKTSEKDGFMPYTREYYNNAYKMMDGIYQLFELVINPKKLYKNRVDKLDEIDINKFNVDDAYDYIMTNSRNSVLISQMEQITKPNDIIRLKEYSEGYSKNFDAYLENLYQQATTTDGKKNILMTKMFGISKQESDILLNSYYKNLSLEELENARKYIGDESIDYLINLSTISKIDDEITLDQLFKVASGERQDAIKVVSDMKKVYAQTYLEKLGDTNSSIQKLIGEISTSKSIEDFSFDDFSGGILLKVNGKEIPIIEAPDKFDFLIHSTGAYNPQKLNGGSYFDAWNNSDRTRNNGICCSYITESQIGMASIIDGDAVVYGFSGFSDEALSVMGPTDISSINDEIDTTSYKTPLFITADKLSENSVDNYNELVLYRTELRDTTSNLKNIQPNYVFVFDNSSGKLKENAIKAASAYDPPLPIIYLSKEKVVTEGATKIDTLLDSFKTNHNVNDFEGALKLHESLRTSLGLYENQVSKLPESKITDAISDYLIGIVEQAKNVPENNLLYIEQLEQVKSIIQEEGKKFTSYYEHFMHKTYDIDSSVIRNIDDIISYLRGES